jgi:hypothetical protein
MRMPPELLLVVPLELPPLLPPLLLLPLLLVLPLVLPLPLPLRLPFPLVLPPLLLPLPLPLPPSLLEELESLHAAASDTPMAMEIAEMSRLLFMNVSCRMARAGKRPAESSCVSSGRRLAWARSPA